MNISNEENSRINSVKQLILKQISKQQDGILSFDKFMEIALYTENLGYYEKSGDIFGKNGDFMTASELGNLFSKCVNNEILNVLQQIGGSIYEFGAGSGRFSKTVLDHLEKSDLRCIPRFNIIEKSRNLLKVQKEFLSLNKNVAWYDDISNLKLDGFLIANELLDAMPAKCFIKNNGVVTEYGVGANRGNLFWDFKNSIVPDYLITQLQSKPDGFRTEYIAPLYLWLQKVFNQSGQIVLLILDYGSLKEEFYQDSRGDGTIKCHYKHQLTYDPLIQPGLKDITVSVDFSLLEDYATKIGYDVLGFAPLEKLLANLGILEIFEKERGTSPRSNFDLSLEAKQLLMPNEMGYSIKALALGKNFKGTLLGFRDL